MSGPGDPFASFGPPARAWFERAFGAPTPVQARGWARIAAGEHALLLAPTGSGKTLAAFFACIDRLSRLPADAAPGVRVLYVSPLKALVYDIERNLRAPLAGVQREARARGGDVARWPRVAVRTGDTTPRERRSQARDPAEILVTTPESLYLILGSQQRETLATVDTVIVDEIHALAPTKRGAHLALSLERVAAAAAREPQRVGLSATARPPEEVARFLGGDRDVAIVDASEAPRLDLEIRVPVDDMTRPDPAAADGPGESAGMWPAIVPALWEEIQAHRSTIVFTNSRGLCERLARQINDLAGETLARAHHGSVAHGKRREIEEALKAGTLRAIVATSSLELGIDMGAVDLVLLVESPGAVSRGLQRVGRAGHHVGDASRGLVYPKHRGDLLEATVVARGMRAGDVEPIRIPQRPLDVLAQQVVAMCAVDPWTLDALEALLRRTASFAGLSSEALFAVLDMLSGRYPSTDFASLRARIRWDRDADRLEALAGSKLLSLVSGGTIPDRGLYAVHRGEGGPRIGELDEEMVNETRPGEVVTLGASSWRVDAITRDRVLVSPAPGEVGKLPFWRGDGPGRPIELGRALGAFVAELGAHCGAPGPLSEGRGDGEAWLRAEHGLDERAARNLVDYVVQQQEATGALPSDRAITVERFRDELGDWRVCILSPFGARVHAPWALAIESRLPASAAGQTLWSDDGIALRFADGDAPPSQDRLIPDPDELEAALVARLADSPLFASHFRENAARALLLPRRRPGSRTPLWSQRLRAQNLLAVAREFPSFPILLETYRTCLQDVFDVPALVALLRDLRDGTVHVDAVETRAASPFARSLVFAYTAAFLYQGDTPVAERRAQALTLDRAMLRDLLGEEDLRTLLDADVIHAVSSQLAETTPEQRVRHVDALHDLLRRQGDLSAEEAQARCDGDAAGWLATLTPTRRVVGVALAGERRWIAAEDAGLYRDAFGVALPGKLPAAFLAAAERPLEQVVSRFARHRGPFRSADLAARYAVDREPLEEALRALVARGRLLEGGFLPGGSAREWCDPDVLRRLRRRTLAKLRDEVAPVDAATLARFLPRWHGVGKGRGGEAALRAALETLEGHPLSFAELERIVLPARVSDYDPQLLDELGTRGEWLWVGRGAVGARDARIALLRRDRAGLQLDPPAPPETVDARGRAVLAHLEEHGASFLHDLAAAAGDPPHDALLEQLWELAVAGLVTNDSFSALRGLAARRALRPRRGRRRPGSALAVGAGRWSAVSTLVGEGAPATRRAHAVALALLERHGVLCRDAVAYEEIEGGFAAVYPLLREMEEAGKLRRGHFVEALRGAQFALAPVVDRLRACRAERAAPGGDAVLLGATDPANPFGAQLPWPAVRAPGASPRRAVGASVVIVDGALALFLDRAGRSALTFAPADPAASAAPVASARLLERGAAALRDLFRHRRRALLRIETIDGIPATASPWAGIFRDVGFRSDYKGLVLERSAAVTR